MTLRKLELKDAPFMLEWMHDNSVVKYMQADFASKTIDDCVRFIKNSSSDSQNLHLAIADEEDQYMGTVSLKNIKDNTAEFAITIRSIAMGKGISKQAMKDIIDVGFNQLNLSSVYWCVSPENVRAVRFYDKNGYHRVLPDTLNIEGYNESQISSYYWYCIEDKS